MRLAMAGWAATEYSRQTDTAYEKSTTYAGHKAMEEYDQQKEAGALRVFVADRFLVEVEGHGLSMEGLRRVLEKVDVNKIAGIAHDP